MCGRCGVCAWKAWHINFKISASFDSPFLIDCGGEEQGDRLLGYN